jgi:hypothetical protein
MSWNNVVSGDALMHIVEQIRKEPKQLHFDEDVFPPLFSIKEEYLTSCNEAFTWVTSSGSGPSGTIAKAVDHPAFNALRSHLAYHGYIKKESGWVNGDRVTKPFYLNEVYFNRGDKFVCGSAMSGHLKFRKKYGKD